MLLGVDALYPECTAKVRVFRVPEEHLLCIRVLPQGVPGVVENAQAKNPGLYRRRRRRVRSEVINSDEDAPFVVPGPSRRLVLVPESAGVTPQSIQDRERDTRLESGAQFSMMDQGDTLVSSDEEPLVPCSRNSVVCTGSTVPASTGALLDAGVEESQFGRNVAPKVDERSGQPSHSSETCGEEQRCREWAAAGNAQTTPGFDWLTEVSAEATEAVHFHGGQSQACVALRSGWTALSWEVNTPEDLVGWDSEARFHHSRSVGTLLPEHRSSFCQRLVQPTFGSVSWKRFVAVTLQFGSCQWGCANGETSRSWPTLAKPTLANFFDRLWPIF